MSPHDIWYDWSGLNTQCFLLINGYHAPALDALMLGITNLGHPALYPFYLAVALVWSHARPASLPLRNVAIFALSYVLVSMLLVPALKSGFDFPRPAQVLGNAAVNLLGTPDTQQSFPSGHAAFAVLLAVALIPGITRAAQASLVTFALLVCVSRIWVGAHYPADVLAGSLLAMTVVTLTRLVIRKGPKI
ncbi:phosphatase PAP2 family protein [Uliginosibacterium aquaticum]|uniref:Phosphatase PAP2 family protein n=1 Tax=Uliginosibacterium aquaticum TaxID=2731212 RepID=A0ABX2IKX6_9RHOO|nr:phosphatase PAP2 family protein [Uliginosibacterium aquaticum]NSL54750.1 phosphatase PAP2 family protein [Uliginosibacterium aquaticum]